MVGLESELVSRQGSENENFDSSPQNFQSGFRQSIATSIPVYLQTSFSLKELTVSSVLES